MYDNMIEWLRQDALSSAPPPALPLPLSIDYFSFICTKPAHETVRKSSAPSVRGAQSSTDGALFLCHVATPTYYYYYYLCAPRLRIFRSARFEISK